MPVPPLSNELISLIFEHLYLDLPQTETIPSLAYPTNAILQFADIRLVSRAWNSLAVPFLVRNFDGRRPSSLSTLIERYPVVGAVRALVLHRALVPKDATKEVIKAGATRVLAKCTSGLAILVLLDTFWHSAVEADRAHPLGLGNGAIFAACPKLDTLSLTISHLGEPHPAKGGAQLICPRVKALDLRCCLSDDLDADALRNFLLPFLQPVQATLATFSFLSSLRSGMQDVCTIFDNLAFPNVLNADLNVYFEVLVPNLFSIFPNCHTFSSISADSDPDWASFLLPATLTTLTFPIFFQHAASELSLHLGTLPSSWGAVKRLQIHLEREEELTSAIAAALAVECARLGITLFFDGWMDVDETQQEELRKVDADMKLFWQEDRIRPDDENWSEPDNYAESDEYTNTEEEEGSDKEEVEEDWDAEDEPGFEHLWSEKKKREMGIRFVEEEEAGKE